MTVARTVGPGSSQLVVLERPRGSVVFAGTDWPVLGDARFVPEGPSGLAPRADIPDAYWESALRHVALDPLRWIVAHYADMADARSGPPPTGMTWIGYDVGEMVWVAFGGFSLIHCEAMAPGARRAVWWSRLNGFHLFPDLATVRRMLADRERDARSGHDLETHFADGIRIYRVAMLSSSLSAWDAVERDEERGVINRLWPTRQLTAPETELLAEVVRAKDPAAVAAVEHAQRGALDDAARARLVELLTQELVTEELDASGEPTERGARLDDLANVLLGNIHGPHGP